VIRAAVIPYLAVGAVTLYLARWFDREGLSFFVRLRREGRLS
jgi:hypothetical protein